MSSARLQKEGTACLRARSFFCKRIRRMPEMRKALLSECALRRARAKADSEMKRSGIERALRVKESRSGYERGTAEEMCRSEIAQKSNRGGHQV